MIKPVMDSDALMNRVSTASFVCALIMFFSVLLLLMNRIPIHSDVLWLEDIVRDMKHYGIKEFFNWYTAPAPQVFPDMLIYLLGDLFLKTPLQKIWFLSSMQAALLVVFSFLLLKKIAGRGGALLLAALLVIVSIQIYASTIYTTWSYYHGNSIHYGVLVLSLLSIYIAVLFFESGSLALLGLFCGVNFLCQISSKSYAAFYVFPALITMAVAFWGGRRKRCLLIIISMIVTLYFAFYVDNKYMSHLLTGVSLSGEAISNQAAFYLKSIFSIANVKDIGNVFWCSLFVAVCAVPVVHILKCTSISRNSFVRVRLDSVFIVFMIFLSCVFFSVLIAPAFQGRLEAGGALHNLRYFNYFFMVASLLCLYVFLKHYPRFFSLLVACLLPVSVFFSIFFLKTYIDEPAAKPLPYVDILKKMKPELGLKDGVATFWNARLSEIYLDDGFRVYSVLPTFIPFRHILNTRMQGRRGESFFNYVIVDKTSPQWLRIDEKNIPLGYKIAKITDAVSIYYYNDNYLNSFIQRKFLENILPDGKVYFSKIDFDIDAVDLPSRTGSLKERERVATMDKSDFLIHGPYVKLPKGKYIATFYCNENTSLASYVDVFSLDMKPEVLATTKLSQGHSVTEVAFTVENDALPRIETRVFYDGSGTLAVERVNIKRIDSQ